MISKCNDYKIFFFLGWLNTAVKYSASHFFFKKNYHSTVLDQSTKLPGIDRCFIGPEDTAHSNLKVLLGLGEGVFCIEEEKKKERTFPSCLSHAPSQCIPKTTT